MMHLHTIDQFAICRYAPINDRSICVCRGDRLLFMHLLKCQKKKLRCMQHTYTRRTYSCMYIGRSMFDCCRVHVRISNVSTSTTTTTTTATKLHKLSLTTTIIECPLHGGVFAPTARFATRSPGVVAN